MASSLDSGGGGRLKNLGANDIYFCYMAASSLGVGTKPAAPSSEPAAEDFSDLKINLIYPCTAQHVAKYSRQGVRLVTETAAVYASRVRPYMERKRAGGRLNWVYNIIEGRTEAEDVVYRTAYAGEAGHSGDASEGFLLLPDLNWDRTTAEALHLLAVVERRDIWSLRDLKRRHVPWLRRLQGQIIAAATEKYRGLEADQLKMYLHYQPTYYHFHVHVVHVALEAGATQATGKAIGFESIMALLESMQGGDDVGLDTVPLSYTLGEASELWIDVFEPLKKAGRDTEGKAEAGDGASETIA